MDEIRDLMISVIVPAYNVEEYIEKCLDSIINQTYTNLEIIVVDDGSTDNTGHIIDKYGEKDHRIKIIHQSNGGLSAARNTALDRASGDYISFVDGDDFLELNAYQLIVEVLKENPTVDVLEFGYNKFDNLEQKVTGKWAPSPKGVTLCIDVLNAMCYLPAKEKWYQLTHMVWNKVYKFEHLHQKVFMIGRYYEDFPFNIQILSDTTYRYGMEECLYNYRINRTGAITSNISYTLFNQQLDTFRNCTDLINMKKDDKEHILRIRNFAANVLFYYLVRLRTSLPVSIKEKFRILRMFYPYIKKFRALDNTNPSRKDALKLKLFMWFPFVYYTITICLLKLRSLTKR